MIVESTSPNAIFKNKIYIQHFHILFLINQIICNLNKAKVMIPFRLTRTRGDSNYFNLKSTLKK